ncbi:MAG: hypothetical protein K1W22_14475 [Lachnospiraceae bacterium]
MINEIGSEFWKEDKKYINDNERLFLSGRTALDAIIKDAKKEHIIKSVLLPSYCCHTMIEPFMRNNIKVRFYDVYIDENGDICADIPIPRKQEMFYKMNYFGAVNIKQVNIQVGLGLWDVSVEDTTHSCFCDRYKSEADYEFASYRKWFALEGFCIAKKNKGFFLDELKLIVHTKYCKIRKEAFHNKYTYMNGGKDDKKKYLNQFDLAEKLLEEDYVGYCPDLNSIVEFFNEKDRFDKIKYIRRKNASILVQELKEIEMIQPVISKINENICPLCFPIILPKKMRDGLKKYLIEQDIYVPIHWPISKVHSGITNRGREIYDRELSLICDHRYDTDDMKREANIVRKFFNNV